MRVNPLTFIQLSSILRGRRRLIAATWAATVAVAIGATLALPARWHADAAVVVDVKAPDMLNANASLSAGWIPGYVATQADVLGSERVVLAAVDALGLAADPAWHERWTKATGGAGDLRSWIAGEIRRKLEVRPARESNALYVGYTARDPQFAAGVVNAVVDGYIDLTLEMRVEPSRQFARLFDERSAALRERLEAAQAKLSQYQRENGIVAAEERYDAETARLNELTAQLVSAQNQVADAAGRRSQAMADPARAIEVTANPQVAGLSSELARQQVRLEELGARLGDRHPQVIEVTAVVAELRQRLTAATTQARTGLVGSESAGRERLASLEAAVAAQRERLLTSKAQRDVLAVLQRDVDAAQKALDFVLARGTEASLARDNDQTNVTVLQRAVAPVKPSNPGLPMTLAIALLVGGVLGVLAALAREMVDRRLRTTEDVEHDLQTVLFGTLVDTSRGRKPIGRPMPAALPSPVAARS